MAPATKPDFHEWRPHPWHGLEAGRNLPTSVNAYIEITPFDLIKYEVDKASGYVKVDRPQRTSSQPPSLYGFIPRTYCAERVAELCSMRTGQSPIVGDGDPLDICVLTEKTFSHGDLLVKAAPIGGLRMVDAGQADDKIVGVLAGDAVFGSLTDIADCPPLLVERLATRTAQEWFEDIIGAGVPCGPINTVDGGVAFAEQIGLNPVVTVGTGDAALPGVRHPIRFSDAARSIYSPIGFTYSGW